MRLPIRSGLHSTIMQWALERRSAQMVENAASERVEEIQRLTQSLSDHAHAGNWDDVAVIEAKRRPLLLNLFDGTSQLDPDTSRALLKEVLSLDEQIMSLAQQQRDELAQSLRQLGQGRTAIKAYDSNAR